MHERCHIRFRSCAYGTKLHLSADVPSEQPQVATTTGATQLVWQHQHVRGLECLRTPSATKVPRLQPGCDTSNGQQRAIEVGASQHGSPRGPQGGGPTSSLTSKVPTREWNSLDIIMCVAAYLLIHIQGVKVAGSATGLKGVVWPVGLGWRQAGGASDEFEQSRQLLGR